MKTYIALFRGVNVLGSNRLPMKELTSILEKLGARKVTTYIQSGNAVFQVKTEDASRLAERIGAAIHEKRGFRPHVFLREAADLERAIAGNPFPEAEAEPRSLHVYFLDSAPGKPDLEALKLLKKGTERYSLNGDLFYLHTPEGVARSRLAAGVEKALGVPATARNWRSIREILNLARPPDLGTDC